MTPRHHHDHDHDDDHDHDHDDDHDDDNDHDDDRDDDEINLSKEVLTVVEEGRDESVRPLTIVIIIIIAISAIKIIITYKYDHHPNWCNSPHHSPANKSHHGCYHAD